MSSATHQADLDALKLRKALTDDIWVLTLVAVIVAIGVPWFQRILDVRLAPIAWTAFAYSCVYFSVSYAAERSGNQRWFLVASVFLQVAGVVTLGALWRLSGALQNPMFLLVFTLPVITASILLPRWYAFAAAGLAVA